MLLLQILFYMQYDLALICFLTFSLPCRAILNQYVHLSLVNPDIRRFYIPKIKTNSLITKEYFFCNAYRDRLIEPWKVMPIHA